MPVLGHCVKEHIAERRYSISFGFENPPYIEITIQRKALEQIKEIINGEFFDYLIQELKEEHNLGRFTSLEEDFFGFGGVIRKYKVLNNGAVVYRIEIPSIVKFSKEPCIHCNGKGLTWFGSKCLECDGVGYEMIRNVKPLIEISASLQILTMIMDIYDGTEATSYVDSYEDRQLLTFKIFCGGDGREFGISGSYGVDIFSWMSGLRSYELCLVSNAMREVFECIYKKDSASESFEAYINSSHSINIMCPGEACEIYASNFSRYGYGADFSCHNVDTASQQLMLLAGLAAFSDMAVKYLRGK